MRSNKNSETSVVKEPVVTTPEARENELIALAYDAVAERIRSGQASSAELVHFLKLGSTKERITKETLMSDIELKQAKVKAIQDGEHLEEVYNNAIEAMKRYSGNRTDGDNNETFKL